LPKPFYLDPFFDELRQITPIHRHKVSHPFVKLIQCGRVTQIQAMIDGWCDW
jgi:hypothetical protein